MRFSPATLRRPVRAVPIALLGLLTGLLATLAPAVPVGPIAAVAPAPSASGASAYLCWGYSGCRSKGYSDDGYGAVSSRMYWRMYGGHNCTNYVAYRMIRAGMSTERPWSGSGNAYNWGLARRDLTDQTPAVGAVAWWNRNVPGAGSVGHVAYVERVLSPTVIVVSQDSWGGDFSWQRLEKGQRGWPSGFIHFNDRPTLVNTAPPRVVGTPQVGVRLLGDGSTWKPGGNTYAFQWYADGVAVAGATNRAFTPTPGEAGKTLTVRVTASRAGMPAVSATSAASRPVAPGALTSTAPPVITGDPTVGGTLTVTGGTYRQGGITRTYTWYADGVAVGGVTGASLTLASGTIGKTITVRETASAPGYTTARVDSAPLGPVSHGPVAEVAPVTGSGATQRGATLAVTPGRTQPNAPALYSWLRDGTEIPGATAATYRLGTADVGRLITARVRHERRGFLPLVREHAFGTPVSTEGILSVKPTVGRQRVVVRVSLRGVGLPRATGPVRVMVGQSPVEAVVRDGYLRLDFAKVSPGRRGVRVAFRGTEVLRATYWSTVVVVPR